MKKIVAITACPVGIAHTYMAAENLQKAAAQLGVEIKVETQGSVGAENILTDTDIKEAEGVIFAADKNVDKSRFQGKQYVETGVQDGIHKPEQLIQNILDNKGETLSGSAEKQDEKKKKENPVYRHLMNGVSFMIPFIVVGGLLIAISLSLGGVPSAEGLIIPEDSIWSTIEAIGAGSFAFMVPILAGFIAMSIADRPGLAPGMIGVILQQMEAFTAVKPLPALSAVLLPVSWQVMWHYGLKNGKSHGPSSRLCYYYYSSNSFTYCRSCVLLFDRCTGCRCF